MRKLFNEGDEVVFILEGQLIEGEIEKIWNLSTPVAMIKTADGNTYKVAVCDLAKAQSKDKEEPVSETEKKPGRVVTISDDEFAEACVKAIEKMNVDDVAYAYLFAVFGAKVGAMLFSESNEDDDD